MRRMEKQDYVAGFLFSKDLEEVVLIEKNRPSWQKGKLNGVGGKVEPGERPTFAMTREFAEETGLEVTWWRQFCVLKGHWGSVTFYTALGDVKETFTLTDENIWVATVHELPVLNTVKNLKWLIPMAIDSDCLTADVVQGASLPW